MFFYSYRDGEPERSHYSMLQSILYQILHNDDTLFYPNFQAEYRKYLDQCRYRTLAHWDYEQLKTLLKSLPDHSPAKRLYLVIDAVDESDEQDRRDVLKLLFKLCTKTTNGIIKVFIASRPVRELELINLPRNFIRIQDHTKPDITRYAESFLKNLKFESLLASATRYIVDNAQGVFVWVKLVGEELLDRVEKGYSEKQAFTVLQELPRELESFYEHMLSKLEKVEQDLKYGMKMFHFVLFARRPLKVDELLHALGIPDHPNTEFLPSDDVFLQSVPAERCITHCGGNFLEFSGYDGKSSPYPKLLLTNTDRE